MNRYIRIEGYPEWFLYHEKGKVLDSKMIDILKKRLYRKNVEGLHSYEKEFNEQSYYQKQISHAIDITTFYSKEFDLLIRDSGTMMTYTGQNIVNEYIGNFMPFELGFDLVICENDADADYKLKRCIKNKYPNIKIKVINFFDTRNIYEIKANFDYAKYVTFSTTFNDFAWFSNLVMCLNKSNEVFGYCDDTEKWNTALKLCPSMQLINL